MAAMSAHNSQPKANPKNRSKTLRRHNGGFRFLQDGNNAIIDELLATRKSRLERGLLFYIWVPREDDLIFENPEARVIKYDTIVFAAIRIDKFTVESVVDHLLSEDAVKT